MYQIPKPPNNPHPKQAIIILTGIGILLLFNRYRIK